MDTIPFSSLSEFLVWASTPAGLMFLYGAVSIVLREMPWFEALSAQRKATYTFVLCVFILPLLLVYIPSQLPPATLRLLEPLFSAFLLGAFAYLSGNQTVHELWNKRLSLPGKTTPDGELPSSMDDLISDLEHDS